MAVKEFNMNKIKRTFWPLSQKDKTVYDKKGDPLSETLRTERVLGASV